MRRLWLSVFWILLLSTTVFAQVADTTFFYFKPYRSAQPLQPEEGWARFDSLVSASWNYDLIFLGTADMATRVYQDLEKGVLLGKVHQRPMNSNYSMERGNEGFERAGRGTVEGKVVQSPSERGLYIIRVPRAPRFIKRFFVVPDTILGYVGTTKQLLPMIEMNDGSFEYVDGNAGFTCDTLVAYVNSNGLTTLKKRGETRIVANYKNFTDTVYVYVGRKEIEGKPYLGGIKFPELKFPDTMYFPPLLIPTKNVANERPAFFGLGFGNSRGQVGGGVQVEFPSGAVLGGEYCYIEWLGRSETKAEAWFGYKIFRSLSVVVGFNKETELNNHFDKFGYMLGFQLNQRIWKRIQLFTFLGLKQSRVHQHVKYGDWDFSNDPNDSRYILIKRPIKVTENRSNSDIDLYWKFGISFLLN